MSASEAGGNPRARGTPRSQGEKSFKKRGRDQLWQICQKGKRTHQIGFGNMADTGNLENQARNMAAKGPQLSISGLFLKLNRKNFKDHGIFNWIHELKFLKETVLLLEIQIKSVQPKNLLCKKYIYTYSKTYHPDSQERIPRTLLLWILI